MVSKAKGCLRGCLTGFLVFIGACMVIGLVVATFQSATGRVPKEADVKGEASSPQSTVASKNVKLLSSASGLGENECEAIEAALISCGIDGLKSVTHDEMLDGRNPGETGYRIDLQYVENIILYLAADGSVSEVRWIDHSLYKDGGAIDSLSNYTLTIDEESKLQYICKQALETVLLSPATAKYPNILKWQFYKDPEKIIVQSYVDAQNAFGATIRSEFQATFSHDGQITSFIFEGRELIN